MPPRWLLITLRPRPDATGDLRLQRIEPDGGRRLVTLPMQWGDVPPGALRAILREADPTEADLRRLPGG
jgi:hypothetical protein